MIALPFSKVSRPRPACDKDGRRGRGRRPSDDRDR
jgi:hypothetical protein